MKKLIVVMAAVALGACESTFQPEPQADLFDTFQAACDSVGQRRSPEHTECMWQQGYAWREQKLDSYAQQDQMMGLLGAGTALLELNQPRPAAPVPQMTRCQWYGQTLRCL